MNLGTNSYSSAEKWDESDSEALPLRILNDRRCAAIFDNQSESSSGIGIMMIPCLCSLLMLILGIRFR